MFVDRKPCCSDCDETMAGFAWPNFLHRVLTHEPGDSPTGEPRPLTNVPVSSPLAPIPTPGLSPPALFGSIDWKIYAAGGVAAIAVLMLIMNR